MSSDWTYLSSLDDEDAGDFNEPSIEVDYVQLFV